MNKVWWKESVAYEIYTRSFCDSNGDGIGDIRGVISKLDYLKELGINVIWMAPVYKSPNDDNGYDVADYRNIMEEFGTMEDFDELLSEAHKRGLKIIMDLVVNHTSDEHAWFVESRSSKDNEKRDYYIWRDAADGHAPNNWGSCFSGPAWDWDEKTQMYYLHCFSKKMPDLNWENPRVRDEVYDLMTWWLDKGIDGFRMDVITMISKKEGLPDVPCDGELYGRCMEGTCNGPHVHDYLREMRNRVLSKYDIMTVGEGAGLTVEEAKKYANSDGSELDMMFQFEHLGDDDGTVSKWSTDPIYLPALKENLTKWQLELDDVAWNSLFFSNHDQPRMVSRLGDGSPAAAKCIATMVYMMQGTPFLYQGEELGMTNCPFKTIGDYRDIESINAYYELTEAGLREPEELLESIAYRSRDNARTPMQWSDEENAGFTTGKPWIMVNPNYRMINAKAQLADPDSVFNFYKKLIRMRRESDWSDVIVYGKYELLAPDDEAVYAYIRSYEGKKLIIVCNMAAERVNFHVPENIPTAAQLPILSCGGEPRFERDLLLDGWQAAVWIV